jgi:hypothetical protein
MVMIFIVAGLRMDMLLGDRYARVNGPVKARYEQRAGQVEQDQLYPNKWHARIKAVRMPFFQS